MTKKKEPGQKLTPGRKGKYHTHIKPFLDAIAAWTRQGCLEKDIMQELGVSHQTWYTAKREQPELLEALNTSLSVANAEVENSLYQKATGYIAKEYQEAEEETPEGIRKTRKTIYRETPPDTLALKYWLNNKNPEKWRDQTHNKVEVSTRLEDMLED